MLEMIIRMIIRMIIIMVIVIGYKNTKVKEWGKKNLKSGWQASNKRCAKKNFY